MNVRTRRVMLVASSVLVAGVAIGGVAFLVGGGRAALVAQAPPDELRYVPSHAMFVAYVNVHEVMRSTVRSRLRELRPEGDDGRRHLQDVTGIDLERDVDHVVLSLVPGAPSDGDATRGEPLALALLVGRFDRSRLEALAGEHGGQAEDYAGHTVLTGVPTGDDRLVAMSFVDAGVLALGGSALVRGAIDASRDRTTSDVTSNERLMRLMAQVRGGHNLWAVAELDGLDAGALLSDEMRARLPPLRAMALGSQVNGGVSTTLTIETRDDQAARDLGDVVRGFVALARMQAGLRPELRPVLDSIRLTGDGNKLTMGVDLPADLLDLVLANRQVAKLSF